MWKMSQNCCVWAWSLRLIRSTRLSIWRVLNPWEQRIRRAKWLTLLNLEKGTITSGREAKNRGILQLQAVNNKSHLPTSSKSRTFPKNPTLKITKKRIFMLILTKAFLQKKRKVQVLNYKLEILTTMEIWELERKMLPEMGWTILFNTVNANLWE